MSRAPEGTSEVRNKLGKIRSTGEGEGQESNVVKDSKRANRVGEAYKEAPQGQRVVRASRDTQPSALGTDP